MGLVDPTALWARVSTAPEHSVGREAGLLEPEGQEEELAPGWAPRSERSAHIPHISGLVGYELSGLALHAAVAYVKALSVLVS